MLTPVKKKQELINFILLMIKLEGSFVLIDSLLMVYLKIFLDVILYF